MLKKVNNGWNITLFTCPLICLHWHYSTFTLTLFYLYSRALFCRYCIFNIAKTTTHTTKTWFNITPHENTILVVVNSEISFLLQHENLKNMYLALHKMYILASD